MKETLLKPMSAMIRLTRRDTNSVLQNLKKRDAEETEEGPQVSRGQPKRPMMSLMRFRRNLHEDGIEQSGGEDV